MFISIDQLPKIEFHTIFVHNYSSVDFILKHFGMRSHRMLWILSRLAGVVRHEAQPSDLQPLAVTISMTFYGIECQNAFIKRLPHIYIARI